MHTTAKLALAGLATAGLLTGSTAAVAGGPDHGNHRGQVTDATYLKTFTAGQVDAYVEDQGFARPHSKNGVDLYRLVYRTVDPDGAPTTASGLVALPQSRSRDLRLTSYTHGTISNRADAASVSDDDDSRALVLMFGGTGLAVSAPDYLGLGLGPGSHPYAHLPSETSASADMLLATRELAGRHGLRLRRDVAVSGFSQGGRVAVNLGKQLRLGRVPGFGLDRVAAVAGPYDLEYAELPAAFDGRMDPKSATYYLGYFATAWKTLAGLYDRPADAFRAPYDRSVEGLFDGDHTMDDILAGLPDSPHELFKPEFERRLLHPAGRYAELLRRGDRSCQGWTADRPVRLYYGSADREVVPTNTAHCLRTLTGARGIDVGPVGHFESRFAAYPRIAAWFAGPR